MYNTVRKWFCYLVILLGSLAILATLLSLTYDVTYWWLKVLDFPREQLLILLLLCLVLFVVLNANWNAWAVFLLAGLISAAGLQAYFILPYTPLFPEQAVWAEPEDLTPSARLSLFSANVYMHNRQDDALITILKDVDPDLVLLMETNTWWENALEDVAEAYPYSMEYPLDNTYGMLLYSRFPLLDTAIRFFQHEDVPSFHAKVRLENGAIFYFHGMHPVPPTLSPYPDNIGQDEESLLEVADMIQRENVPALVAGDFNDVAWSNTHRLFQQETRLNDLRIGKGLYNTYNAQSFWKRWPLDHVYVSDQFRVLEFRRLPGFGSDHFPIFVELVLPN